MSTSPPQCGPTYLYNGDRVGCFCLLGVNIAVDTRWVGPGLSEGDEGTEPGDIKQSQVEPRPTSSRKDKLRLVVQVVELT